MNPKSPPVRWLVHVTIVTTLTVKWLVLCLLFRHFIQHRQKDRARTGGLPRCHGATVPQWQPSDIVGCCDTRLLHMPTNKPGKVAHCLTLNRTVPIRVTARQTCHESLLLHREALLTSKCSDKKICALSILLSKPNHYQRFLLWHFFPSKIPFAPFVCQKHFVIIMIL